jgi:AcrR family transcriptional regulator
MPRSPDLARARLIAAGERLFAERGIDNVSLREISRESGSRNVVALQHHFTDRNGLLQAILEKHHTRVESHLDELLDAYEASEDPDLRTLAAALVEPFAACLDDEGGRHYLQIFADLINRPRLDIWPHHAVDQPDNLQRWRALVDPYLSPQQRRLHRRFAAVLYAVTELARWSRAAEPYDSRVIANSVTDLVSAMLAAEVSTQTRASLRKPRAHGVR